MEKYTRSNLNEEHNPVQRDDNQPVPIMIGLGLLMALAIGASGASLLIMNDESADQRGRLQTEEVAEGADITEEDLPGQVSSRDCDSANSDDCYQRSNPIK
jgi:hypothetical protein